MSGGGDLKLLADLFFFYSKYVFNARYISEIFMSKYWALL